MNRIIIYAVILLLTASCSRSVRHEPLDIYTGEYTYTEPISSISDGTDCIWVGTQNGNVARLDLKTMQYSAPIDVGNRRVYCVEELPGGNKILVGVQNAGLKLVEYSLQGNTVAVADTVKTFSIEERGTQYSPYRICRGSNGNIYVGTSNGLFYLSSHDVGDDGFKDLREIKTDGDKELRYTSLSMAGKYVAAAGTAGLYVADTSSITSPKIHKPDTAAFHLGAYAYGDTLYAMNNSGALYSIVGSKMDLIGSLQDIPTAFACDSDFTFHLFHDRVEILRRHGDGKQTYSCPAVTCSGKRLATVSLSGKHLATITLSSKLSAAEFQGATSCFLKKGDFYYVSTVSSVVRLPRHINFDADVQVSDVLKYDDNTLVIKSQGGEVYKYDLKEDKCTYIRELERNWKDAKWWTSSNGNIILSNNDSVFYSLGTGHLDRPEELAYVRKNSKPLKHIVPLDDGIVTRRLPKQERLLMSYSDSMFLYGIETHTLKSIDVVNDFYAQAFADMQDILGDGMYMAGTLNHGLYTINLKKDLEKYSGNEIKTVIDTLRNVLSDDAFKEVVDICVSDKKIYVLTSYFIHVIEYNNGYERLFARDVPKGAERLVSVGGRVFVACNTGGLIPVGMDSCPTISVGERLLKDIVVKKALNVGGKTILLTGNGSLIDFDGRDDVRFLGIKSPSALTKFLYANTIVSVVFRFIFITLIIVGVWTYLHSKRKDNAIAKLTNDKKNLSKELDDNKSKLEQSEAEREALQKEKDAVEKKRKDEKKMSETKEKIKKIEAALQLPENVLGLLPDEMKVYREDIMSSLKNLDDTDVDKYCSLADKIEKSFDDLFGEFEKSQKYHSEINSLVRSVLPQVNETGSIPMEEDIVQYVSGEDVKTLICLKRLGILKEEINALEKLRDMEKELKSTEEKSAVKNRNNMRKIITDFFNNLHDKEKEIVKKIGLFHYTEKAASNIAVRFFLFLFEQEYKQEYKDVISKKYIDYKNSSYFKNTRKHVKRCCDKFEKNNSEEIVILPILVAKVNEILNDTSSHKSDK